MGVGTIVIGLAAVILGEAVLRANAPSKAIVACVFGAIVYRLSLAFALENDAIGLTTSDLNALTAAIVTLAFILPKVGKISTGRKMLRIKRVERVE